MQGYLLKLFGKTRLAYFPGTGMYSASRCFIKYFQSVCFLVFRLIVSLFHGPVLSQKIQSLQFLDDKLATVHQLPDLVRICHILVLHEGILQALSEVHGSFGIFSPKIKQL